MTGAMGDQATPVEHRLVGRQLDEVQFGHMLRLFFAGGFELQVESGVRLVTGDGDQQVPADVEPGTPGSAAVSGLVGRTVAGTELLSGAETGGLRIDLGDGVELRVAPDTDYEAWNLTGPDRQRAISLPGGEISTWAADPPSRVQWFGSLPAGRAPGDIAGVVRRTIGENGYPVDEAFTRSLRWERTWALRERDLGHDDMEYVEITEAEGDAFVERVRGMLGG